MLKLVTRAACCVLAAATAFPALSQAPIPATPAPVDALVYARSFRLDEGFVSPWGADKPFVTEGTILVLDVDTALVRPRQSAEPVLYVGNRVAQRIVSGWPTGRMIVLVPGEVDLDVEPVFFGTPELPERIDVETATEERDLALQAGIVPLPGAEVSDARSRGGSLLRAFDSRELDQRLYELYEEYVLPLAPQNP